MKSSKKKEINAVWFPLDNAAKIFPPVITARMTEVFRVSATLKKKVDPEVLQRALDDTMERFPYYRVTLKRGFFWYYLQETDAVPQVREEIFDPCQRINRKTDAGLYFRVLYYGRKISAEFCHVLTDGTGGVTFLRALVARYLILSGIDVKNMEGIPSLKESPDPEEFEDSYKRYYKNNIPFPAVEPRSFHVPGMLSPPGTLNVLTGIVPVKELMKETKHHGVTVTEYLTAHYIFALQQYLLSLTGRQRRKLMKPIRVMVPVNLRSMYASKTMRNFFLSVKPGIDPRLGYYTFEEIIREVYHYMRVEINEKFINQQIARNVASEVHPLIRIIPLVLKVPVLRYVYNHSATARHSGVLTNLGRVTMPPELEPHIERFEGLPNPNPLTRVNVGLISFKELLYISFVSFIESREIEKLFFRSLRKEGVPVKIETN